MEEGLLLPQVFQKTIPLSFFFQKSFKFSSEFSITSAALVRLGSVIISKEYVLSIKIWQFWVKALNKCKPLIKSSWHFVEVYKRCYWQKTTEKGRSNWFFPLFKGLAKLFLDLKVSNFNSSVGCLKLKINHILLLFSWIIAISSTPNLIKNDDENLNLF